MGARTWGVPWEGMGSGGDAKRRGGGRARSRVRTEMPVAWLGTARGVYCWCCLGGAEKTRQQRSREGAMRTGTWTGGHQWQSVFEEQGISDTRDKIDEVRVLMLTRSDRQRAVRRHGGARVKRRLRSGAVAERAHLREGGSTCTRLCARYTCKREAYGG